MSTRSRKEEKNYGKYQRTIQPGSCQFCAIGLDSEQLVKLTKSFKIIRNIFSYSIWDGQKVDNHLMIVPRKHTDSLANLTPAQSHEFLLIVSDYESRGYNIYARAPSSTMKSVIHQHTHLIKTSGATKNMMFLLRKPFYIRIAR